MVTNAVDLTGAAQEATYLMPWKARTTRRSTWRIAEGAEGSQKVHAETNGSCFGALTRSQEPWVRDVFRQVSEGL